MHLTMNVPSKKDRKMGPPKTPNENKKISGPRAFVIVLGKLECVDRRPDGPLVNRLSVVVKIESPLLRR